MRFQPHNFTGVRSCLLVFMTLLVLNLAAPVAAKDSPPATPVVERRCTEAWIDDARAQIRSLTGDCVTTEQITIPAGWSLDGQNFTIYASDGPTPLSGPIVQARPGQTTVRRLTIDGSRFSIACVPEGRFGLGLADGTTAAEVTVRQLGVGGEAGCGSAIIGPWQPDQVATVTVRDSFVANVGGFGIVIGPFTKAEVSGTEIRGSDVGLQVFGERATLTARANTIVGGQVGIRVETGAAATIADTQIEQSDRVGIVVASAGTSAELRRNTIADGAAIGIAVVAGATAAVSDNQVTGVADRAIVFANLETVGSATSNTIVRAGYAGLAVEDGASAELRGNILRENGSFAMLIIEAGVTTINNNRMAGGTTGIHALASDSPIRILANTISDMTDTGIRLEQATGEIRSNTITEASVAAINLDEGASGVIDQNVVDGGKFGIVVQGEATTATVSGNQLDYVETAAISIEDSGTANVHANEIRNRQVGIYVQNAASGVVTGNTIVGGLAGIVVLGAGSHADVTGNVMSNPFQDGVAVIEHASAVVEANEITNARSHGIRVQNAATAEVADNTIVGPGDLSVGTLFGPFGIYFASGASGSAERNAISGFLSDQPGSIACAIGIELLAGSVVAEPAANWFPAPGNTSAACVGVPPPGWAISAPNATPIGTPVP